MRSNLSRRGHGLTALIALAALTLALYASAGIAAETTAVDETCAGCRGCDSGASHGEEEDPFSSHHHCCTTCCISHAPLTLSPVFSTPVPVPAKPISAFVAGTVSNRAPETPYHPPRV